jgi:diguanylate cyclase (GGDEF)-like protein/PAS domain S-box-containing protein
MTRRTETARRPTAYGKAGGEGVSRPRQSKDLQLLRRLVLATVLGWSVAIGLSLYFNLGLMQGSQMQVPAEIIGTSKISFAIIWLLGLIGIAFAAYWVHRHLTQRLHDLGEQELSAKVFEDGLQAIVITDPQGDILRVNPMFSEMTGFEPAEVIGQNISLIESDTHSPDFLADLWHTLRTDGGWVGEMWKRRKSGETFATWESISAVDDEAGEHLSYIFMFQDITDRKLFSSRLEQLAHYDPLTHLPNRRLLSDRVGHAVQRASRRENQHALLFIDLDHFKRINDTVGHTAGDRLLTIIADRLLKCVRASDTVARLGGDEFAVLLEDVTLMEAERVAGKVLAVLAAPVQMEGRDWYVGASIGISLTPRDGVDMASLLKNADTAMYRAKADGRHCFRFFDEGMAEHAALQVARETALHLALEKQAFSLHYQPQIEMTSGKVIGIEALIRWRQGDKMIPPLEFIPLAEETGLIVPIGRWLLGTACRDVKALHDEGHVDLKLAVNISAVELKQADFVEQILFALAESGLPATSLELEITESTMLVDVDRVASVLDSLAATGISLSIDDFGTGYSSLSYLKQLPVDFIKIDRSFVRDTPKDKEDCTIVRAIVTMTHTLGLRVVAEGVETEEQAEFLRREGCDVSQGYLHSRPVPLQELRLWLADRQASLERRKAS